jgi:glycosyltransferase involved in cell wall biosynthesis
VSVVTPVYNGDEFLRECVDSVLAQTHTNWTMSIVDNASTDETAAIAAAYAARDPRIRHVRFESFVGQSQNINRAFSEVDPDSDWCKPLMADDWLYPRCLEEMIAAGEQTPRIGLVTAYQRCGDEIRLAQAPWDRTVVPGRWVVARNLLSGENLTGSPSAQLYPTEIVRQRTPFYDVELWHEDTDAAYRTLVHWDLGFVHQVLGFERIQEGTQTDRAMAMGSALNEHLLFIARYGRQVMGEEQYRRALLRQIRIALRWQLKQVPNLRRLRSPEFFEYQAALLDQLDRANAGTSRLLASYVEAVRLLHLRGRLAKRG